MEQKRKPGPKPTIENATIVSFHAGRGHVERIDDLVSDYLPNRSEWFRSMVDSARIEHDGDRAYFVSRFEIQASGS